MFDQNNLTEYVFTFLPALIYAMVVYMAAPVHAVRWKTASLYFCMGILSTFLVSSVQFIFPSWGSSLSSEPYLSMFIHAFIQVALLEELCKFASFKIADGYRNSLTDHPSGIMFYCMSVSAGFAFAENLLYVQSFGGEVLLIRSFSAVITHLICGLMMGYFIALRKMEKNELNNMGILGKENSGILYSLAALMCSTFFHGLYDFNIFAGATLTQVFMLVGFGLCVTYLMSNQIFRNYKG